MKKLLIPLILFTVIFFGSCKKFIELAPKGQLVPQKIINYRYLLNNSQTLTSTNGLNEFGTDDVDFNTSNLIARLNTYLPFYTWDAVLFQQSGTDQDWTNLYKIINNANVVINGVPNATDGSDNDKNELIGEAMVHRAHAYWVLVNQYAKQYDVNTASTDLGIPLLTTPDIQINITRSTIQQAYDLMISDLNTAITYLPAQQANNVYPSKAVAYGLLARVYLFMGNYSQALLNANSALSIKSDLLDLNAFVNKQTTLPAQIANPEIMLLKQSNVSFSNPTFRLSDELVNLLGSTDLRYSLYTDDGTTSTKFSAKFTGRGYVRTTINGENFNSGLTVPEVLLTKAECQARTNDYAGAILTVNSLRMKRFLPINYTPLTASSAADALKKILDERRRELFMNGLRWFDLKRLNTDPVFAKTLTHGSGTTVFTLAPNSNNYLFPIAPSIIQLSPGIIQNQRN